MENQQDLPNITTVMAICFFWIWVFLPLLNMPCLNWNIKKNKKNWYETKLLKILLYLPWKCWPSTVSLLSRVRQNKSCTCKTVSFLKELLQSWARGVGIQLHCCIPKVFWVVLLNIKTRLDLSDFLHCQMHYRNIFLVFTRSPIYPDKHLTRGPQSRLLPWGN